ncbi:hypothetical protein GCM10010405_04760 [Streptomyces macrosporus]|uniref:S-adenosyl methyltransferase n=2 Tax=Streptomyces macrosporus TaxID=44032 RepID=A0ABP5WFF7_9ACTN
MLTLEELTTGADALLRAADKPTAETGADGDTSARPVTQAVEQVEMCDTDWRLRKGTPRMRNALAVVPTADRHLPDDPRSALRTLARQGVVAVVTAPATTPPDPALPKAAQEAGVHLLVPTRPCTAPELLGHLLRRLADASRDSIEQRDRLLDLSARLYRQGEGPGPLLHWLSARTSSRVTVLPARDDGTWADLSEHAHVLERLAAGEMRSAAVEAGGRHVRLHPIGSEPPHRVLAAVRETPWPGRHSTLIAHAAERIALLQQPLVLRVRERRLRQTEMAVRINVFQHLMAADVVRATRTAAPLSLDLFDADACEVAVMSCAPGEERSAVVAACDRALDHRGLVVMCPVEDTHVIVVRPQAGNRADTARPLKPVVAAHRQRALGVSPPAPWTEVESAYTMAFDALVKAQHQDDRTWVVDDAAPLARLLPAPARVWAAALLSPLRALPEADRRELCDTARLALMFGASRAARLSVRKETEAVRTGAIPGTAKARGAFDELGRNTIARKLSEAMDRVGLDHSRLGHRAVMDLALKLDEAASLPPNTAVPSLVEILAEPAARDWAARLLAPLEDLDSPARHLGLLATWAECNGAVQETAAALGRHRDTITRGLTEISAVVSRRLTESGHGQNDVWLALATDTGGGDLLDTLPARAVSPPGRGEPTRAGVRTHDTPVVVADGPGARKPPVPGTASSARIYNAVGGGKDNYPADERIAREIMSIWPEVGQAVAANRAFIHTSARWLAEEIGIRQFLDIGAGIPTPNSPSLHETVQRIAPTSRVLYVDNDSTVLAHAATLRSGSPEGRTDYLHADATDPDTILTSHELANTLDLNRPVALYLCALLHLIGDDQNPREIVRRLTTALAPGSYVVVSHATPDANPHLMDRVAEVYARDGRVNAQGVPRSRARIEHLLGDGLELVEPGIVSVHRWRPGEEAEADLPDSVVNCYALVARKNR